MIQLDLNHAHLKENVKDYQEQVVSIDKQLVSKTCLGNDFIGWMTWANDYDREEFARIKECAKKIRMVFMQIKNQKSFIWEIHSQAHILHR